MGSSTKSPFLVSRSLWTHWGRAFSLGFRLLYLWNGNSFEPVCLKLAAKGKQRKGAGSAEVEIQPGKIPLSVCYPRPPQQPLPCLPHCRASLEFPGNRKGLGVDKTWQRHEGSKWSHLNPWKELLWSWIFHSEFYSHCSLAFVVSFSWTGLFLLFLRKVYCKQPVLYLVYRVQGLVVGWASLSLH